MENTYTYNKKVEYMIAENMKTIMKKHNRTTVWYGDLELIEECARLSGLTSRHPKATIKSVLDALDKNRNFKKTYMYEDFSGVRRKYRCFTLEDSDD